MKKFIRIAVITSTIALALSGCSALQAFNGETSTPNPAGAPVGFEDYYGQVVSWEFCGVDLQCATVSAPTNWSDSTSAPIELALVRHKATSQPAQGDILVNPGGPGESAVNLVRDSVDYAVDPTLVESFNIVGLDPRGVGGSTPVTCYKDAADMDKALYSIPSGVRGSAEWNADVATQSKAFADACLTNTGPLLEFVDTQSAARDMDMVRAAMGNLKLDYLGYSYGTFLGSTYANLFPQNVGRMVLDGAVDSTASPLWSIYGQTVGFEGALNAYLAWCVDGGDCPLGASVPEATVALQQLLADVDTHPLENSDGRLLGGDTLVTAILWPLYDNNAWSRLSEIVSAVYAGDASVAFEAADGYNGRNADGTYANNSTDAFIAINCADAPRADDELAATVQSMILTDAPILGPYFSSQVDGCADWPVPSKGSLDPIHASGAPDLLVIGTTNDPATPYDSAVSLSKQLESAHLVTFEGEGHTAYNRGNACINDIVDTFFLEGAIPGEGITCS